MLSVYNRTPWSTIPVGTIPKPTVPTLETTIPCIQSWLDNCRKLHQAACYYSTRVELPTRVIDVGSSTSDPRLYISQKESTSYIALATAGDRKIKGFRNLRLPETTLILIAHASRWIASQRLSATPLKSYVLSESDTYGLIHCAYILTDPEPNPAETWGLGFYFLRDLTGHMGLGNALVCVLNGNISIHSSNNIHIRVALLILPLNVTTYRCFETTRVSLPSVSP